LTWLKKLSQFGHNDRKGKLVDIVTANFNAVEGQMTKTSQGKKTASSSDSIKEMRKLTIFTHTISLNFFFSLT